MQRFRVCVKTSVSRHLLHRPHRSLVHRLCFNVLMGERYKVATKETKDVLLGKYGQTVKPFNPEIVDKVLGEEKKNAITCRPADLLEPELDKIEAEMKQWKQQDEDVLSYALFPQVATEFFKYREAQQKKVDASVADTKNGAYPV